jgi:hypothetical protein
MVDGRDGNQRQRSRRDKFRSLYWKTSLRRKRQLAASVREQQPAQAGGPGTGEAETSFTTWAGSRSSAGDDAVDGAAGEASAGRLLSAEETEGYILDYLKDGASDDDQAIM